MPFNLLLLPLLGGYIFITYWNRTRFDARRYSGERLIFHAAIAGVALLIAAHILTSAAAALWPGLAARWHRAVPFEDSATSLLAFVLGATAWWPANQWGWPRDREVRRTIEQWNDYLEMLLARAAEENRQVAATLKSGKVYIGYVLHTFDPAYDRRFVVLLPVMSGYRRPPSHELVLTTDYARVYQTLLVGDPARLARQVRDFQIVVPVAEIQSANLFDWGAYGRFQQAQSPGPG